MSATATLRVYAWLRHQRPDLAAKDIEIGPAGSVQGLLDAVELEAPEGAIILVNGEQAALGTTVRPGDTVSVFPLLDGG